MNKVINQINNKLTCCYLKQIFSQVNSAWKDKTDDELWFIQAIWQKLEKDQKLCESCSQGKRKVKKPMRRKKQ